ncbi:MAG: SDR family oxidoreductase [Phycisphaerales bacterium]
MPRQVIAITGASAGVGRAVAREFARRGCDVALMARGRMGLDAACREAESLGARALACPLDAADPAQVEGAAERIEREFGEIGVWVNSAMVSVFAPVMDTLPDEFRRVTEVTYLGVVHGTQAALRRMLPRDRGVIIQVGSALSFRSIPLQSAYCAAKHAVAGFTDSLRCELLHRRSRVRLSIVHIPAMNTPHFSWVKSRLPRKAQPVPPIFQPEVAARAIAWAADHDVRDMMVGAPTLAAVWGGRLAPAFADRYLSRFAWDAQQTSEPEDPARPDNLWQPVEGDFGARGQFSARASDHSPHLWLRTHLAQAALAGAGLALAFGAALAAELAGPRRQTPARRARHNGALPRSRPPAPRHA